MCLSRCRLLSVVFTPAQNDYKPPSHRYMGAEAATEKSINYHAERDAERERQREHLLSCQDRGGERDSLPHFAYYSRRL